MQQRARKFVGMIMLVAFVCAYALAAMIVAAAKLRGASGLTQLLYFAAAGLLWVVPAGILIRWMQKS
ncbi:MAG TPA: DUF2842 domain-containing protein [Propylenella sp.]